MKYLGSKLRLAKHFLHFISEAVKKSNGHYYEPFVGGANVFQFVEAPYKLGSDIDCELIEFLNYLKNEENPNFPYITKELHTQCKLDRESLEPWMRAYVSICGSFNGIKNGSYAGHKVYTYEGRRTQNQDFPGQAVRVAIKQAKQIKKTKGNFQCIDYTNLYIPENSVVYCDPPYQGTYSYKLNFDHEKFWEWVRQVSLHSQVFVSECTYPEDFKPVWTKERKSSLAPVSKTTVTTETLVVYKGS